MVRTSSKAALVRAALAAGFVGSLTQCAAVLGFEDHEPFPLDGGSDVGGDVAVAAEAGIPDAAPSVPNIVGSRVTLATSVASTQMALPAGARPGDIVIVVIRCAGDCVLTMPADWAALGNGYTSSVNSSRTTTNWLGYRVLQNAETDATTFEVKTAPASTLVVVAIVARGVRATQPVSPVGVETPNAGCDDAGLAAISVPGVTTRGTSRALFVIGVGDFTPFSFPQETMGLSLLESTSGTAVYGNDEPVANATAIAGPQATLPIACTQRSFLVSLGIVAE